ncbi:response regulator [Candidatus Omnitrophota bacterium]
MKERILIIEDDQTFRQTLDQLLQKEGYSVTGARDGFQAMEQAKKNLFELIVADVRLPGGMDGIEAIRNIKEIRPDAKSMAIVITGYADEDAPIRAIKVGVDDYIYKPFKSEEFLHSVERNIKVRRLEKELEEHLIKLEKMNISLEKVNAELKTAQAALQRSNNELENCNVQLEQKVQDKTKQLKQAEAQLLQSAKMSAIGQLGAGVAHELNNPLGGILGYAQFILKKMNRPNFSLKDTKPCKQYVEYIEKEAKRCMTIVENLLVFSRKSNAVYEPLDIQKAIEATLAILRGQLKITGIKVAVNYAKSLPQVSGNINQLQQVFTNIIINAQNAMPKGGELQIKVDSKAKQKQLAIKFQDTGSGIAKENLDKVFDPFFTTKQDWKSVGIGLAISYQIVQEHKGAITVSSQLDKGSIFTVTLPAL